MYDSRQRNNITWVIATRIHYMQIVKRGTFTCTILCLLIRTSWRMQDVLSDYGVDWLINHRLTHKTYKQNEPSCQAGVLVAVATE